jgi:pimeloyl-ACP methyl ester carboxylesterase
MTTLNVPGATLYYETQGTGPVLLLIPGGAADAGVFAGLALFLSDRYTVMPYDPRGNSRSVSDDPTADQDLDVHGDDAAALLAAVTDQPAYVLGNSGGAQIGLNLAARHPTRVHTLVAHEPPCAELLPDADKLRAAIEDVYQIYRRHGVEAGMQRFQQVIGLADAPPEQPQGEPTPKMLEGWQRIAGNLEFFLAHGVRPITGYVPDVAGLRAGPARIVVGVGEAAGGSWPTGRRSRWPSGSAVRRWSFPATTAPSSAAPEALPRSCTRSSAADPATPGPPRPGVWS